MSKGLAYYSFSLITSVSPLPYQLENNYPTRVTRKFTELSYFNSDAPLKDPMMLIILFNSLTNQHS